MSTDVVAADPASLQVGAENLTASAQVFKAEGANVELALVDLESVASASLADLRELEAAIRAAMNELNTRIGELNTSIQEESHRADGLDDVIRYGPWGFGSAATMVADLNSELNRFTRRFDEFSALHTRVLRTIERVETEHQAVGSALEHIFANVGAVVGLWHAIWSHTISKFGEAVASADGRSAAEVEAIFIADQWRHHARLVAQDHFGPNPSDEQIDEVLAAMLEANGQSMDALTLLPFGVGYELPEQYRDQAKIDEFLTRPDAVTDLTGALDWLYQDTTVPDHLLASGDLEATMGEIRDGADSSGRWGAALGIAVPIAVAAGVVASPIGGGATLLGSGASGSTTASAAASGGTQLSLPFPAATAGARAAATGGRLSRLAAGASRARAGAGSAVQGARTRVADAYNSVRSTNIGSRLGNIGSGAHRSPFNTKAPTHPDAWRWFHPVETIRHPFQRPLYAAANAIPNGPTAILRPFVRHPFLTLTGATVVDAAHNTRTETWSVQEGG